MHCFFMPWSLPDCCWWNVPVKAYELVIIACDQRVGGCGNWIRNYLEDVERWWMMVNDDIGIY